MRYHIVWFINGATLLAVYFYRVHRGRYADSTFLILGLVHTLIGVLVLVRARRLARSGAARSELVAAFREGSPAPSAGPKAEKP